MTTLHVTIDRSGPPLHRQIYDGLRRSILDGLLRPGQRVPSTRSLAVDLAVSRQPVLAAYEQLLHEGYLEGRHGSGTYVTRTLPDHFLSSKERGRSEVFATRKPRFDRSAPEPNHASHEDGLGPFRMSQPALDRFPHTLWARLVARHARALRQSEMAYGDPVGTAPLRVAVAEHLRAARAVSCDADRVLIVSGSQAALRIAAAVLLERGDRVAIEEPGYSGARVALGAAGARLAPVAVDSEGLSVTALRRLRARLSAAYVTPSHQYPLGVSMSAARRLELLEWSRRTGAWLLEDDYDSEYRYVSRPLGALQGVDPEGRVLYIGTFSKVMFPALRVGYIVVPPTLKDRFIEARRAMDLFSPTLYQLALAEFLREGHFARHLRRMRVHYLSRRNALLAGLERDCGDHLTVINSDAGLHVATTLNESLDDRDIVRRMERSRLTATPLSTCYAEPGGRSGLLLGFGGSNEAQLSKATGVLGELLRR